MGTTLSDAALSRFLTLFLTGDLKRTESFIEANGDSLGSLMTLMFDPDCFGSIAKTGKVRSAWSGNGEH